MALWDRILSLFRSAPAPQPPRPRVHGRVVWGTKGQGVSEGGKDYVYINNCICIETVAGY